MSPYRPDDALLAGVCAEIARRLGWNVWAVRGVFAFGLFINALWVGVAYILMALVMGLGLGLGAPPDKEADDEERLSSPEIRDRARRIEDLERKFRDLEDSSGQRR